MMKRHFAIVAFFALFLANNALAQGVKPSGKVIKVMDGDSLLIKSGRRNIEIRLDSVDAPEYSQNYGQFCKARLTEKLIGRDISFTKTDTDRYGRVVAVVYLENRNINREIVSDGCAWAYRKYLRDKKLVALEQQAKRNKKALWSDKKPIPPWLYRKGN